MRKSRTIVEDKGKVGHTMTSTVEIET